MYYIVIICVIIICVMFKNSTRDMPSNLASAYGRRRSSEANRSLSSSGRPSLTDRQLPVVASSEGNTGKTSPYLAHGDKSKHSSADSSTDKLHQLLSVPGHHGITEEARKAVENCTSWEFDVIQLETITNHR